MHADALAEEAQTLDDARQCSLPPVPSDILCHSSSIYRIAPMFLVHTLALLQKQSTTSAQSLSLQTTVSEPLPSFVSFMLATPFELKTLRSTRLDPWHCAPVAYISHVCSRSGPQHG